MSDSHTGSPNNLVPNEFLRPHFSVKFSEINDRIAAF